MSITPNIRLARIEPYGGNTAPEGGLIDFYLPQTGYIDLSTLCMFYTINVVNMSNGCLSRNAESMIQTLEVFVNGECVNYISNYNQIFNLLADFAFTPKEVMERAQYRNQLTNGSPTYDIASLYVNGRVMCCKKWLGWLGCNEVIDLTKNNVHIRITVAPKFVFASNNANFTFSLSNIYMSANYYTRYNLPLKSSITYDDFKSVFHYNSTGVNETALKVVSDNLDYVVAFCLATNYASVQTGLYDFKARYFARMAMTPGSPSTPIINSANFKLNGTFIYQFELPRSDALMSMMNLFPNGFPNVLPMATATAGNQLVDVFTSAFGAPVKLTLEQPEEIEIAFSCSTITASLPTFLFVKLDKTVQLY